MVFKLVLTQSELLWTIMIVFSALIYDGDSRSHTFSNHFGGIPEAKLDSHLVRRVHLRVARSDDTPLYSTVQISSQDPTKKQSKVRDEKYKRRKSAKVSTTRRYIVVFDIGGCLCLERTVQKRDVYRITQKYPECPLISWNYTGDSPSLRERFDGEQTHMYLPFLQILFDYLLRQGTRIAFFSAGFKERNVELIPGLLKFYWSNESYEKLRSEGQFMIFSKHDLIERCVRDPTDKDHGDLVKDLNKVIRDEESLSDIILVDNDFCFTAHDQKPSILINSFRSAGELMNNVYYLLGLFKDYFENENLKKLPLRDGIKKIFSKHKTLSNDYVNRVGPFFIRMSNIGLLEVQKMVPEAKLYDGTDHSF